MLPVELGKEVNDLVSNWRQLAIDGAREKVVNTLVTTEFSLQQINLISEIVHNVKDYETMFRLIGKRF